ncbi:hypothetical protein CAEBREN_08664 [Caenorhabditis brenneri]|uniref:Bestrophin homolog n=1 Tax=Caenorhabditis brenneri TaxID=135651 RepID=G0MKK7_CAEBE|nr:hypothetical protein CAEBREN_08664 [Caenorhabditis brenneri]
MTVSYNQSVATSRPWTFIALIFRWRGSVWKAIWIQYSVWLGLYFLMSGIYRFVLQDYQRRIFVKLVDYTSARLSYVPLDWMLGFFIAGVLRRFWYLYDIIGFIDNIACSTATYIRGDSDRAKQYRRNIIRYCELTQVLIFRDLSMKARKRFPTLDTVAAAGFMMPHEKANFDQIQYNYNKYFLPFNWAWALVYNARKEGLIEGDYYVTVISEDIKKFRTGLAWVCNYDWVPLPIIYPTIVCLAVHMYFFVCIMARQYVDGSENDPNMIDLVFPFMTSIQFVFYMGWLKVGEGLLNPWGEDDDDFETNMLIDRNLAMGLKIVDEGYDKTPRLEKDAFWDDTWVPLYSEASAHEKRYHQRQGSLAHIKLSRSVSQVRMVPRDGRRASIVKERIVNVKPEETNEARGNGIGDILRPASLLNLMKHAASSHSLERQQSPGSFRMETLSPKSPTTENAQDNIEKKD